MLLIAADRHRIDLRKTERPKGYGLFEFVSGRLTNHHVHPVIKTESLIWGYNKTCGFCLLKFNTRTKNPEVKMEAYNNLGKLLFVQKILASDLIFTKQSLR